MTDRKRAFKRISRWTVVPVVALGVGVTAVESGWGEPSTNAKSATPVTKTSAEDGGKRPLPPRGKPAQPPTHDDGHPARNINPDIRTIELNVNKHRSNRAFAESYDRMLNTMRASAGPSYRQDVRQTTADENRFLRLRITGNGGPPVDLYYTAHNLYLRGYVTHHDSHNPVLYELGNGNDSPRLGNALRWNPQNVVRTNIPVDYPGLRRGGAESMDAVRLGRGNLMQDIGTLNNTERVQFDPRQDNPEGAPTTANLSRSLLRLIVATAEGTRFPTLSTDVHGALLTGGTTELDLENQELINHWNALSHYVVDVTNNTNTPPRRIAPHIPELDNFREAQSRIAILHTPK